MKVTCINSYGLNSSSNKASFGLMNEASQRNALKAGAFVEDVEKATNMQWFYFNCDEKDNFAMDVKKPLRTYNGNKAFRNCWSYLNTTFGFKEFPFVVETLQKVEDAEKATKE